MILYSGNRKLLVGKPWSMFELRTERCLDEIIYRIGSAIPRLYLPHESVEVFLPLDEQRRLKFGYLLARGQTLRAGRRIRQTDGVEDVGIVYDDSEIQLLIADTRAEFRAQSKAIISGSFVRVRAGLVQGYCGRVVGTPNGTTRVEIRLFTKRIELTTPTENLVRVKGKNPAFYSS